MNENVGETLHPFPFSAIHNKCLRLTNLWNKHGRIESKPSPSTAKITFHKKTLIIVGWFWSFLQTFKLVFPFSRQQTSEVRTVRLTNLAVKGDRTARGTKVVS